MLSAALAMSLAVGSAPAYEQTVEILNPEHEQRVEILDGTGEQQIAIIEGQGEQQMVIPEDPSAAKSAAMNAAKGAVAVLSVGISLASMAAALLLM